MVNWTGGMGGAMSGAKFGSMFGPWGTGIGAAVGGITGLFGGGMSEEQKLALAQMKGQMERENRFWQQAQGDMGQVRGWASPILGGSRSAAMEAAAPEIQGAVQRMDMGRQSLLNLGSRSGAAAQNIDPYAKGMAASSILQKLKPQAANVMGDVARTTGGWAQSQGQGGQNMWNASNTMYDRDKEQGRAFHSQLEQFADWASKDPSMAKIGKQVKGWLNKIPGLPNFGTGKQGNGEENHALVNDYNFPRGRYIDSTGRPVLT